jgi:dipeptidyl aminopeptidase/acylaminoacyl peptidase
MIIKEEACVIPPLTYAQDMEMAKSFYEAESDIARQRGLAPLAYEQIAHATEAEWNVVRAHVGFECRSIRYLSDGLEINGFIYKPVNTAGKSLPIVIMNRGGNRDYSAWNPWSFSKRAYRYAQGGFVVLASQYRGGGGSQGMDEFGGADVNDVLNLISVAKSLEYADPNKIFMHGYSRGGMMTYQSIRRKAPIRAAAVLSGISDYEQNIKDRPEMRNEFVETVPGFAQHEAESIRDRSAVHWVQEIAVPVLLLHGTADWRVDASDALRLAQELQRLNKPYQLMIFAQDSHGLPANRRAADLAAIEWFRKWER